MVKNEEEISEHVQRYLESLGFSKFRIGQDVATGLDQKADLVVFDQNNPLIVVEFKRNDVSFPSPQDPDQLRFHPFVRQLQTYAINLKAPYYLLSNGDSFLWFRTDESGRPSLLHEPVRPHARPDEIPHLRPTHRDELVRVFRNIKELLLRKNVFDPSSKEAGILILAKLLSERGDNELRQFLLSTDIEHVSSVFINSLSLSTKTLLNRNVTEEALWTLDQIRLTDAKPQDLLSALDEVFINPQKGGEFRINRWLADFLARLAQLNSNSVVWDISSSYGDLIAATWLLPTEQHPRSAWGVSATSESAIWAQIQQTVFDKDRDTVFEGNPLLYTEDLRRLPAPTHIISAPSFGVRIHQADDTLSRPHPALRQAEDLYLDLAIRCLNPNGRIVMLVPEGLLFSANRKPIRRLMVEHTQIVAIISLPSGALLPYSGIKSTILVLNKSSNRTIDQIFMATIDEFDIRDTFDSLQIPQVRQALDEFYDWTIKHIVPQHHSWLIAPNQLDLNNLTVNFYQPHSPTQKHHRHQLTQLKELTRLRKRGAAIKLNEEGKFHVVGPASIRPMILDSSKLDRTSAELLSKNVSRVQAGDIVINNIGSHLGSAAVVDRNSEGSFLSRHVILIRPNTSVITPEYLAAALNSAYVRAQIQQRATGSVMPSLSLERLDSIEIPLPDLETQRKIVEMVNNAKAHLAIAEENLREAESNWSNLLHTLFDEPGE